MLFSKAMSQDSICVMKFYVKIGSDYLNEKIENLIKIYKAVTGINPIEGSLNYQKDKELKTILKKNIDTSDIESLICYAQEGEMAFSLGKHLIPGAESSTFCIAISFPASTLSEQAELAFAQVIIQEFDVGYGYARALPGNYSPISESRIKKSLFGSISADVNKFGSDWLHNPENIFESSIKGLYPYNFVNSKVMELSLIKSVTDYSGVEIRPLSDKILCIEISKETLGLLRKVNPDIKHFIRD